MSIIKCRAIVISTIPYSENSVVLKCYTDLHGLQSYMVNGVRSKKGSIRPSQLQLLTLLELEAYHQQNKNLQRIRELKCSPVLHHLHFDVIKSAVGIFLAEILNKCIREENHADERLFSFIFHAIQILDAQEKVPSNFPVYFLVQLSRYLGFFPEGLFSMNSFPPPALPLSEANMSTLSLLLQSSFDACQDIRTTQKERNELLEWLIAYYHEHTGHFNNLKSHKVLGEVLGG